MFQILWLALTLSHESPITVLQKGSKEVRGERYPPTAPWEVGSVQGLLARDRSVTYTSATKVSNQRIY